MPELTVLTTVTGAVADAAATYEDVYAFHNWLSGKLAGPPWVGNVDWLTRVPPFVVVSQPAAGNWVMLFASPGDTAPKLRRVTASWPPGYQALRHFTALVTLADLIPIWFCRPVRARLRRSDGWERLTMRMLHHKRLQRELDNFRRSACVESMPIRASKIYRSKISHVRPRFLSTPAPCTVDSQRTPGAARHVRRCRRRGVR